MNKPARRTVTMGNASGRKAERGDDCYETAPEAVAALHGATFLEGKLWEPFVGPSDRIGTTLRAHGCDVVSTGLMTGVDFFAQDRAPDGVEMIVSNPPYLRAADAVRHGLTLVPTVIFLLRLNFLESERRSDILDGGQLVHVHVFSNRLPRMHRDGWDGSRLKSETCAHAWFVWRRDYSGPITVNRIRWGTSRDSWPTTFEQLELIATAGYPIGAFDRSGGTS